MRNWCAGRGLEDHFMRFCVSANFWLYPLSKKYWISEELAQESWWSTFQGGEDEQLTPELDNGKSIDDEEEVTYDYIQVCY